MMTKKKITVRKDRDWNLRQKELDNIQDHLNRNGLKFNNRKWRINKYGISAKCCGVKNFLSALRANPYLPVEGGYKNREMQ